VFFRCGTHDLQDSVLEKFQSVTINHTQTCKLSVPLPPEITAVGSSVNCVPSLLELGLRSIHQSLRIGNTNDDSK